MTDEEMVEEYYNSKFKSNESHFSKFDIEQAFLAGLKAGEAKANKEIEEALLRCYQGYMEEQE